MSIRELAEQFPDPRVALSRSIALATLDAIVAPEWDSRWFSFDVNWGEQEQLASMRNGSGDEYSIVFSGPGVFVRGFAHESEMSPYRRKPRSLWPGLVEGVPNSFTTFVNEPAFSDGNGVPLMTVCLWRGSQDDAWSFGDVTPPADDADGDGSDWLFAQLLDGSPESYVKFAAEYFEKDLQLPDVAAIYHGTPLARDQVLRMNPERDWDELVEELQQIGYAVDD
jgi:hypothetical protein